MTLSLAAMTSAVGSLAWTSWITLLNRSVPPARNTSVWTPYFSVNPLVISSISSGRPLVYTRTGSPLAFARSASSSSRSGEGSMASSAALGDPDAVCPGQPLAGAADGAAASCVAVASASGCPGQTASGSPSAAELAMDPSPEREELLAERAKANGEPVLVYTSGRPEEMDEITSGFTEKYGVQTEVF